jgi:hypothetical protein
MSTFPLDHRHLAHQPEPAQEASMATFRITEAFGQLERQWAAEGAPHRLAPAPLAISPSASAYLTSPSGQSPVESFSRDDQKKIAAANQGTVALRSISPAAAATVEMKTTIEGKMRVGCTVELADASSPSGERSTVWVARGNDIEVRSASTGALLETIEGPKPLAAPTAMANVGPQLTTSVRGSPGRRSEDLPAAYCSGNIVFVGFSDGGLRVFAASPYAACIAHRAKENTLESFSAAEIAKVHSGAITGICVAPQRNRDLSAYEAAFETEERCRHLVCVASMDSIVTLWDAAAVAADIGNVYAKEVRLQRILREAGKSQSLSASMSASLTSPTSQSQSRSTMSVQTEPFLVHDEAAGFAARATQRTRALLVQVRPIAKLKGNVAGIRCMSWVEVAVVDKLPEGFAWGAHRPSTSVVNAIAERKAIAAAITPHGADTNALANQPVEIHHVQEALPEANVKKATESGVSAAHKEDETTAPEEARKYRSVDLLVTGDDEGRLAFWNLREELLCANELRAEHRRNTDLIGSSHYTGSFAPPKSRASRSGAADSAHGGPRQRHLAGPPPDVPPSLPARSAVPPVVPRHEQQVRLRPVGQQVRHDARREATPERDGARVRQRVPRRRVLRRATARGARDHRNGAGGRGRERVHRAPPLSDVDDGRGHRRDRRGPARCRLQQHAPLLRLQRRQLNLLG